MEFTQEQLDAMEECAAGPWREDVSNAPKDGTEILANFKGRIRVVNYDCWGVGGEMCPDGTGSPHDGYEEGWVCPDSMDVFDDDPDWWAELRYPKPVIGGK